VKVDHWYDDRGRWRARHTCGEPQQVFTWLGPEIVADAPVWVELRCDLCREKFVTVIEPSSYCHAWQDTSTDDLATCWTVFPRGK